MRWIPRPRYDQRRRTLRVLRAFREHINSGHIDWFHMPKSEGAQAEYLAYSNANHVGRGQLLFDAGEIVSSIGHLRARWWLANRLGQWLLDYADSQPARKRKY